MVPMMESEVLGAGVANQPYLAAVTTTHVFGLLYILAFEAFRLFRSPAASGLTSLALHPGLVRKLRSWGHWEFCHRPLQARMEL